MDTQAFFPANSQLPGDRDGAMMAIADPSCRHPPDCFAVVVGASACPPLWQLLRQTSQRSSLKPSGQPRTTSGFHCRWFVGLGGPNPSGQCPPSKERSSVTNTTLYVVG
jgi:hypothetical protein